MVATAERNNSTALVTYEHRGNVTLSIEETLDSLDNIRTLIGKAMLDGKDYGVIPGTNEKKVLLLPGAQKTAMYFNTFPKYEIERIELGNNHVEFMVTCRLVSRASGEQVAEGVGSCSTNEAKYRWRRAARKCPHCGKEAIIKGNEQYGGGWLCWKKKDGCGAKFADNAEAIVSQQQGRVENEDIADARNTVLKMAKKRAMVDAAIALGCMSDFFTQDIEPDEAHGEPDAPPQRPAKPVAKPTEPPAPTREQYVELIKSALKIAADNNDDRKIIFHEAVAYVPRNGESLNFTELTNRLVTETLAAAPDKIHKIAERRRKERTAPTAPAQAAAVTTAAVAEPRPDEPDMPECVKDVLECMGKAVLAKDAGGQYDSIDHDWEAQFRSDCEHEKADASPWLPLFRASLLCRKFELAGHAKDFKAVLDEAKKHKFSEALQATLEEKANETRERLKLR